MNDEKIQQQIQEVLTIVTDIKKNSATKTELHDVFEIVTYLKDNLVTQGEFVEFKNEMYEFKDEMCDFKNDVNKQFTGIRDDILSHVDSLLKVQQRHEHELVALRAAYRRVSG